MMWKDFFYFTKTERQGIIVLVVLILGTFAIPKFFTLFVHPKEIDAAEQEKFKKELNEFISSLEEIKPHRKSTDSSFRSSPKREIRLTVFDPNTADSMTFLSLGLPSWMAKNILRYRNKQGRFHHRKTSGKYTD